MAIDDDDVRDAVADRSPTCGRTFSVASDGFAGQADAPRAGKFGRTPQFEIFRTAAIGICLAVAR